MPLVAQAMACYLAGLILGGVGDPFAAVVGCLVFAAAALLASRRELCALAMLAVAGVFTQERSAASHTRCLEGVLYQRVFLVRLLGDAQGGGSARAQSLSCGAELGLFISSGNAPMGSVVSVQGSPARTRTGWVVQHATITFAEPAHGLDAIRASVGRGIDRAFRDDAPLARALLIADKQQIPRDLKDRFASAGLAHLLAIAGLHIAVVGLVVETALTWAAFAANARATILLVVIMGYVIMIGSPPSAVRAATMLAVRTVSRLLQRPTSSWAFLAIGAAEPLIDPAVALSIGYQLSVMCVASLIVAAQWTGRMRGGRRNSRAFRATRALIGTTLATAASAPLVAASFGRVSLIAPLSNLLAEPLFAVLQPLLFGTMWFTAAPVIAGFLADAAHPLMSSLVWLVGLLSSVPGSSIAARPDAAETLLGVAAAVALLAACADVRRWTRWAVGSVACVALIAWLPLLPRRNRPVELRVSRSGRGERVSLITPRGTIISLGEADRARFGLGARMTDGVMLESIASAQPSHAETPVVLIQFGRVRLAVAGPLTEAQELELGASSALANVDAIAVVGRTGSGRPSATLVGRYRPRAFLLMGSAPVEAELARRLAASGSELIRTGQAQSVSLQTDGVGLWIRVDGEDWVPLTRDVL